MQGIGLGFYEKPDAFDNERCLDATAIEAMYNMLVGWKHGTSLVDTMLKVSSGFYVFFNNLTGDCHTYQFLYDSVTYCFRSAQCDSFDIYVYNLGINFFPIVLNTLQILETLIVMSSPRDVAEVKHKWSIIGQ